MTRFCIDRSIQDIEQVKSFDVEGYTFNCNESTDVSFVFHRCNATKRKRE